MKQPVTPALKPFLREICLPYLKAKYPYFNVETLRAYLDGKGIPWNRATLNRYMMELMEGGEVYDAGRGWYSPLAKPFVLDTAPVTALARELGKAFPLVTLSCWSTAQVQGAMHHLLGKFATFVMVETEAMETVWEHLREAGWDAWLNPRGKEAERFAVRERTVVVRRVSRKSPSKEPVAPIEELLVELCFEARDLRLMAATDFHTMLASLAGTQRISMALLTSYAAERKLALRGLFGTEHQLIPPMHNRRS